MEKLNISFSRKMELELEKAYKEAMSNDEFKTLVKKLGLPKDLVIKNVSKLEETVKELNNCKNCKGLYECKNKVSGHVYFPSYNDGKLDFDYVACKYEKLRIKKELEKEEQNKKVSLSRMKDIDITDKNRIELIKKIKDFYDKYDISTDMKGMYVHGSFGSGKTFLLTCLFNELKIKKDVDYEIIYFPELLRTLRDDWDLFEGKMDRLKKVELLLLDDLGAENVTSWGRDEVLGSILQYRMNEKKSTFFTSNLNIKELENHLGLTKNSEDKVKARRIIERIKQLTEDIEIVSINRRD